MTTDDIKAALERSEKATAGPWEVGGPHPAVSVIWMKHGAVIDGYECEPPVYEPIAFVCDDVSMQPTAINDAALIANARTDVPRLARALLVAMEALERIEDTVSHDWQHENIAHEARNNISKL